MTPEQREIVEGISDRALSEVREALEALLRENATLLREHGALRDFVEDSYPDTDSDAVRKRDILARIPDRSGEVKP